MKDIFIPLVLICILSWIASYLGVWWLFVIPVFVIGFLMFNKGKNAFIAGFLGLVLLWTVSSLFFIYKDQTSYIEQVLLIFTADTPLKTASPLLTLSILYMLVGGLLGGFASLTGYQMRKLIFG